MPSEEGELLTHEAIIEKYSELRAQTQQIAQKAADVGQEAVEHESVLKALNELDHERRCFRQIGGVLVERKVGEVIPAVKGNKEQLELVQGKLEEQLKTKNKELADFQTKYKIRLRSGNEDETSSTKTAPAITA